MKYYLVVSDGAFGLKEREISANLAEGNNNWLTVESPKKKVQ
jgi:hypothetical protein